MSLSRKLPVVIEAWPVRELTNAAANDWDALPKPVADAYERGDVFFPVDDEGFAYVQVRAREGIMDGQRDDWIIKGVAGELYPCKPDIFAATYDPVAA